MDQLKAQLAVVKQHSFWVMAAGILVVTLVSWWYSTSNLSQEQQTQAADISTKFSAVKGIPANNKEHPNESTNQGMDDITTKYAWEVQKGWDLQFQQQAALLVWPDQFRKNPAFSAAVEKCRPIEIVPVNASGQVPFDKEIPQTMRVDYRNYIGDDLPHLAKTIGGRWQAVIPGTVIDPAAAGGGVDPAAGGAGALGPDGLPLIDTSLVVWDPTNQQELLTTHFPFVGRTQEPSTMEVLYAQEDLWVLQNIMDIIHATNDEVKATARHEAIVKEINFVRIGRSAFGLVGQIQALGGIATPGMVTPTPTDGQPPVEGAPDSGTEVPLDGGTAPTGEGGLAAVTSKDLAEGRYVDERYQPLPAARLRAALTSRSAADALLAVAKRMPVRIRVKVDQRKLNVLLAACGNSKLPVEVRQVRINREAAAPGTSMSGGGGGFAGPGGYATPGGPLGSADGGRMPAPDGGGGFGGGGGFAGGGFGGFAGGGEGGGFGTRPPSVVAGDPTRDANVDLNLIEVELYGIVYLYNPVNRAQLGLPDAGTTVTAPPPAPDGTTTSIAPTTPTTVVSR